jgi:hypothetical protein
MMTRREEMCELLIDLFDRINIQTPSKFEIILDYCYDNITKEEFNEDDIGFAFSDWIDSK